MWDGSDSEVADEEEEIEEEEQEAGEGAPFVNALTIITATIVPRPMLRSINLV
jgi:hypothetical protein